MPASITTDLVVSSPKVAGRRMLMPVSGPIPGSTPTTVPTRQPRNAYHSTSGCSATEKPSSKLSTVPIQRSVEDLRAHPLVPAEALGRLHIVSRRIDSRNHILIPLPQVD